ncbi:MAG: histidine--tRNA ligase [Candidatus Levybacteria bacterium RIFCSPHIGHO2_12_FULL_38_12]|nr:MAG: histidine--tRNA ligase [Candidatus Levybacteria bacterium RIFCSPHIGHO2_01_FULL_38_12]OGH22103.1 MAG: histidine--tRNA ligase [Candidatus Levybacteria bacterium RIFCSPHIGHO2_02_FULL_37_18]OGH22951.1 MAG: histidine--tRNA ligase [Candidatus Levybacteria bacterium RIFCSPHIGHO2_12_FULL_38_12]OGH34121.1 MAG: histidine--tRNA ligase [Candidatus Levybacteria bacterium RIFCSPLOWO2_01_FULL_37_20]OGH44914.1 MAG: histidine--tRNA ligase [Candidatus Levybacteria bacterium RIFCSPLOWO2_02_FULL_37_18]OGH
MKLQTLKGFRDFLPKEAKKRQFVINTIKQVFESFGFEPLETPALEYEEVLLGKYGQEGDKLMYRFVDNGGRKVAMRYDQTVPTARVVAQYQELAFPFKRYQIQPVWRAENTQKGRFREFLQCDADTFGTTSPLTDAEVIAVAIQALNTLGFSQFKVLINDRTVFENLPKEAIIVIDKLKKIGVDGVARELVEKGIAKTINDATSMIRIIEVKTLTETVTKIFSYLSSLGINSKYFEFSPTLARGLDYYTSTIFEIEIEGYSAGSVCGGGRYDNLIGQLGGKDTPAVGFAFGFDRLMEALEEFKLFPQELNPVKALVTIFSKELVEQSISICSQLRSNNISTELFPDENTALEKQLKYADKKGIMYVVIIGPEEIKENKVTLKNLKTREQKTSSQNDILEILRSSNSE